MCQQLGFDQVSNSYFLTAMTAHVNKLENMEWHLNGGTQLANPSLKETTIAVLDHIRGHFGSSLAQRNLKGLGGSRPTLSDCNWGVMRVQV